MWTRLKPVPPVHRSANSEPPRPLEPTARQCVGDVHDTPSRAGAGAAGAATVSGVQALPSQAVAVRSLPNPGPTARQLAALAHETLVKPAELAGVASSVQVLPFQDSASACWPPATKEPTAMHVVAFAHEIPAKPLLDDPGGSTVASRVQAVPFHLSARSPAPTAMHRAALMHATPVKISSFGRVGGGSVRHALPFHASAIGLAKCGPPSPTAMQRVVPGHETALRLAPGSREGVASSR